MDAPERVRRAQNKTMLPAEPGTYILVLRASSTRIIRIVRLGILPLRPGFCVYIGRALSPGG